MQSLPFNHNKLIMVSKTQLVGIVILSRFMLLFTMAISDYLIPDHMPGNDVLTFDLRLKYDHQVQQLQKHCYCLAGHACDKNAITPQDDTGMSQLESNDWCADDQLSRKQYSKKIADIYRFLLTPLTKWDAARFLSLAANPSLRNVPLLDSVQHSKECSVMKRIDADENINSQNPSVCADTNSRFIVSEQAHAFFPLFPLAVQKVAALLNVAVPHTVLPPTYEGILTLAAAILNISCFVVATVAMYDLTFSVVLSAVTVGDDNDVRGNTRTNTITRNGAHKIALISSLVFAINPANIFFSTAYSESQFAMFTLVGHAFAARGYLWMASIVWMAASYTRSNGTINAAWLLIHGVARCVSSASSIKIGLNALHHVVLACLVAFPVRYHDLQGFDRHCNNKYNLNLENEESLRTLQSPAWCQLGRSTFSLYRYTQKAHWNVGLFRYYEWKQIPNFLLAAPILSIGFLGVYLWIKSSAMAYVELREKNHAKGNQSYRGLKYVFEWGVDSLKQSIILKSISQSPDSENTMTVDWNSLLLKNPILLGHYAVLAVTCLVGLTIAHVQISTRLICSSCPAIIWFISYLILNGKLYTNEMNRKENKFQLSHAVVGYCGLYIALGVILHVNFLPWT